MTHLQTYILLFIIPIFMCVNHTEMPDSSSALPPKDPLEKKWKEVEKLEAKGLPESALKIVEEIQEEAKSKLLKAQIIKTVIYKAKYIHQLEEDGATESIIYFEKEYEEAPRPIKNVFASQLAELYNNYLDQFQWQIKQRTAIDQDTAQDIRQWSLERLVDRITELHLSAVSDPRLQKSNLKEYASILTEGNGETLRPSLFDLLAHRAIDFFSDTKTFLTEPINDFILDKEEYWLPSKKFSKLKITSQNNRSKKFHALKLFQSTVKYQLKSKNHEGLTDLEIKRFQFLREHASILNKDNLYIAALKKLYKDQRRKGGDIVLLAIARYHYQQGDLSQAYTICVQIQDEYKKGRSVEAAKALQANIEKKHFSLEGEQVYIPAEGMLFKASHRNITDLHYRLIKVDPETLEQFNRTKYKRKLDFLRKLEPEYTGMIALPEYDDYKSHTVEFGLEPLDIGRYLMVISDDAKFDNSKNTGTHFLEFQVSNLGIWSRRTFEGMTSIVITDRITGQPLEGVDAHFSVYDRESNSWNLSVTETSDQDGFIVPDLPKNVSHKAYFEHKNDIFYLDDNISVYENRYQDRTYNEVTFFTDRSIYRPGQTIHFKGLLAHFDQDHIPSIQKDQGVTIRLFDANGQEVADKKFTSNAFGTFHGYFTAPEGGLNGSMTLRADEGGYARIQVEEYKRPTFEVNFDTIAGTYQPGDEIRMSGTIMAYAGFGIDNAEIEVRVTKRQKYFFYPWWRRGWMPQAQSEKEILLESLTSDDDGKFEFTFATDPDLDDDDFIFYEYVTHIDATNQAGETRSGENILALSKKPFQLSTSIRKQENIDSLQYLNITAKNFSDQQVGVRGQVKITALISPTTTFVNKYWSKTDSILIDLDEYRDRFPHYAHGDEDQISNWTEAETILNQEFQSQEDPFAIDPKTWGPGYYKMEINASDEAGRSDQQTFYFEVFDLKDKIVPYNTTFWSFFDDRDYEPGESIQYNVGTAEENLMILFEVVKNQELMISKWVPIVDMDKMGFDIRDEDRGNIIAYIHYAKHNRSHNQQQLISVPWTNKALDIKLSTFRDKTKPGSEEEWTVSISPGSDSLKQVELLATMYDASLDAILPHSWYFRGYPYFNYANYGFYFSSWRGRGSQQLFMNWDSGSGVTPVTYPALQWFGYPMYGFFGDLRFSGKAMQDQVIVAMAESTDASPERSNEQAEQLPEEMKEQELYIPPQDLRENLNETVFFFPELTSNDRGEVEVSFTMNEALTRWKFLAFGHTTDLSFGKTEALITTQKELMVIPHLPRFLRQGDEVNLTTTIKNLSVYDMAGGVQLKLYNTVSGEDVNELFTNQESLQSFSLQAGSSGTVSWELQIPDNYTSAIRYEIIANAGDYSDGQAGNLPVTTNRLLVTEGLPLWANGGEQRDFEFKSIMKESESRINHQLTLELTSNPVWLAIQSLPYIMEYPFDCTEQLFNRFFANSLGADIIQDYPSIKQTFQDWKDSDALISQLSKNEELKSAILSQTPWVRDALSEEEQMHNIALLFDLVKMAQEREAEKQKLKQRQNQDGGFSWFNGGRSNTYITQYIIEGIGQLNFMDVINSSRDKDLNAIVAKGLNYIDQAAAERYAKLKEAEEEGKIKLKDNHLSSIDIHYLYARSFFETRKMTREAAKAFFYYKDQARKYWVDKNLYEQAMIGLALFAYEEGPQVADIIASMKERALENEELGMYWKFNAGYHWSQLPIETQSLIIQLFHEVEEDKGLIDEMKKWLIKNKQTNRWETTKATASAIQALLKTGTRWIDEAEPVQLHVGKRNISEEVTDKEKGTGYFKTIIAAEDVNATYANISMNNPNNQPSFGAAYFQYWEDMNVIDEYTETPLKLVKTLFKKENTEAGPKLRAISENDPIEIGDLITVRIVLEVDRPMEFVHMKDSRSSGVEPEDVLSAYKWQDGLGYYQTTQDIATNFFFDYLPRGKYVFEYNVRASHEGNFANGITTIQCMYAPSFTSHSEGIQVSIKE